MSSLHVLYAFILLFVTQAVLCFLPQRDIAMQKGINLPFRDISIEDTERAVYDPGDAKILEEEIPNDFMDLTNDIDINNQIEVLKKLENDIKEEQDLVSKSALLMKLLEDPNLGTLPIVYVEEAPIEMDNMFQSGDIQKRSRYYRRYPWKRQNSRHRTYEPDQRYLCVPSREDVFKLLVGLHENRNGNHQKTVSFCNRKRPAKAIFTNIRFLG